MAKRATAKRKPALASGGLFGFGWQAERELLQQENQTLRLALAVSQWRPSSKKRGRPVGSIKRANSARHLAELEKERDRFQRLHKRKYTKVGTLREMVREIGKSRGMSDAAIERHIKSVKFNQQLKTLLNRLTPSETRFPNK